jgi:hypothetical protein
MQLNQNSFNGVRIDADRGAPYPSDTDLYAIETSAPRRRTRPHPADTTRERPTRTSTLLFLYSSISMVLIYPEWAIFDPASPGVADAGGIAAIEKRSFPREARFNNVHVVVPTDRIKPFAPQ